MRSRLRGELLRRRASARRSDIGGASETTFNEGSAITLHVLRCLVGNRLPEVVARQSELRQQHADGGGSTPASTVSASSSTCFGDAVEQRPRRRRQVQPLGAAVVRVGPALDQPVVAQPVDQPGQRDRLDVEVFGEVGLLEALRAAPAAAAPPIARGSWPYMARLLVGVGPQQAAYIADCKENFAVLAAAWAYRDYSYVDANIR